MTIPEAIGLYLRTEGTNTIAAVTAAKVFWPYPTQQVSAPFISLGMAGSKRIAEHMNGAGAPRMSTIEVRCYAASQSAAWVVAEAVSLDLDNIQGLVPSGGTVRLKRCTEVDRADLVSEETVASGVFAVTLTFSVVT